MTIPGFCEKGGFSMSRILSSHSRSRFLLLLTLLSLVLPLMLSPYSAAQAAEKRVPVQEKKAAPVDLSTAIVQVAKKNIPAVVHIEVSARQEVSSPVLPFENDPFFRYFFGTPNAPKKFKRETKGIGTGMLIDAQGNILTNYHVAGGATKIEVLLADGRKYEAKLVGGDPKTDLAVIRISPKELLPYITFGDSDKMEVGEWVVAIGHPRGLDQTVTQGIISAKHRRGITDPSSYQDFLQTDAAINPGNSGGPLMNLRGEVIGVNTVIVSSSGGFEGIGLAIPSNIAVHISKTLIAHGKVERGWLGVSVQDIAPEQAQPLGLSTPRGALIADVAKSGPAERAGLKKGDVVITYQGKNIPDASALRNEVAASPIGSDARLTILRDKKRQEIMVKIGNLQDVAKILSATAKERLGVEARAATPKEADKYGLDSSQGIVITWVDPKGPLGKVGFEVGDLILEINGQAISSVESLAELVSSLKPKQRITLLALDHNSGNSGYVQAVVR
jgi:serine protease Do